MELTMAWRDTARGRFILTRVLPAGLWLGTMGLVAYLWSDVSGKGPIMGFAHTVQYKVEATERGRIVTLAVDVGQEVRAGQLIAALDPTDVDAEIGIQEAELARLDAELGSARNRATQRSVTAAGRFDQAGDEATRDLREAQTELSVKAAELKTVTAQRKELKDLLSRGLVTRKDLANTELRYARLSREVKALRTTVKLSRTQAGAARARRKKLPGGAATLAGKSLQAKKKVVEHRLIQLRAQRKGLMLRTAMSGRVSEIMKHKGEVLLPGQALATIVSKRADRVVACVYEKQAMEMQVGRKVTLFPRGWSKKTFKGHVMAVGPIVNQLPARCRPERRQIAWGRDMFIQLDEPSDLVPGLAFNIRLEGKSSYVTAGAATPVKREVGKPSPLKVSAKLRGKTRFEPSGLIWVPRLARYVLVSDDTGTKSSDDHAPWLFTMSNTGAVDDKPLVVKDARKFNDLESIAPGDDGALYVLSSQSYSKKGKRKASRQLFARLVPDGFSYRQAAAVSLADLLDRAGAETLRALGLNDTGALDIEGMAATDRGLLLGLKAPLTADNKAIIWVMKKPEGLLSSGQLRDAGLELWGTLALTVTADGRAQPGGVAELLGLPDGSLALSATASGINPTSQDGSLWRVMRGEKGALRHRRLRTFAGLKPEGMALSATPGLLAITFDAGAAVPSWVEIPWSR